MGISLFHREGFDRFPSGFVDSSVEDDGAVYSGYHKRRPDVQFMSTLLLAFNSLSWGGE